MLLHLANRSDTPTPCGEAQYREEEEMDKQHLVYSSIHLTNIRVRQHGSALYAGMAVVVCMLYYKRKVALLLNRTKNPANEAYHEEVGTEQCTQLTLLRGEGTLTCRQRPRHFLRFAFFFFFSDRGARRNLLALYCTIFGWLHSRQRNLVRKTALAVTPAVILGQAGRMPFSNYVIKLDETGVTGAIASSCVQFPKAPSSIVFAPQWNSSPCSTT